jgi:hypothetical protein
VQRVDLDSETVFLDRTKDAINDAPECDETNYREEPYRSQVGDYLLRSHDHGRHERRHLVATTRESGSERRP